MFTGAIRQNAYVVTDLDAAIERWTAIGVGPWYVMGEVPQQGYFLDGVAVAPVLTLAFANSGSLQVELIVQHDDGPSPFRAFPPSDPSGYHHLAWWTEDFATTDAAVRTQATRVAHGDGGGAAQWAYYRLDGGTSPLIEVMELNDATKWMTTTVADGHATWDGASDPVRSLW